MNKTLFLCIFFGCFGMTFEIFFVAFSNIIMDTPLWNEPLWSLTGKTYVWMFPIYVLIPVAMGPIIKFLNERPIVLRLLIYVSGIYLVEFSTGFLLELITGKCPWEYTTGWHFMGYIRLDYFLFWLVFAYIIEYLYLYIDKKIA